MTAPVTVIIAYDLKFYDKLPNLSPHNPAMREVFANNPQLINSSLQCLQRVRWDLIADRCRGSTMSRSMKNVSRPESAKSASRSSFQKVTLNQISYATSVTATARHFLPGIHVSHSPKHVRCCEFHMGLRPTHRHENRSDFRRNGWIESTLLDWSVKSATPPVHLPKRSTSFRRN
jgi:hypothetical protein